MYRERLRTAEMAIFGRFACVQEVGRLTTS